MKTFFLPTHGLKKQKQKLLSVWLETGRRTLTTPPTGQSRDWAEESPRVRTTDRGSSQLTSCFPSLLRLLLLWCLRAARGLTKKERQESSTAGVSKRRGCPARSTLWVPLLLFLSLFVDRWCGGCRHSAASVALALKRPKWPNSAPRGRGRGERRSSVFVSLLPNSRPSGAVQDHKVFGSAALSAFASLLLPFFAQLFRRRAERLGPQHG